MEDKRRWMIVLFLLALFSLLDIIHNILSFLGVFAYGLSFWNMATPVIVLLSSCYFIVRLKKGGTFSGPLYAKIYVCLLALLSIVWLASGHTFQPQDAVVLALYPLFWAMSAIGDKAKIKANEQKTEGKE